MDEQAGTIQEERAQITLNNQQLSTTAMKLNVILFALVCLGLFALTLAHDGEFSAVCASVPMQLALTFEI
jgi:hypothetical protein